MLRRHDEPSIARQCLCTESEFNVAFCDNWLEVELHSSAAAEFVLRGCSSYGRLRHWREDLYCFDSTPSPLPGKSRSRLAQSRRLQPLISTDDMLPLCSGEEIEACPTASPDARRVLISLNPHAGRRSVERGVVRVADCLSSAGYTAEIFTDLVQVSDQANELFERGDLRALVAVGGDGTVGELINRTRPGLPMAIFPAGTANLISRHFGLRADPARICQSIIARRAVALDAGSASGRLFLVMASCGFDAEVVNRVHECRLRNPCGGHFGYASYLKPILESIRSYSYPEIRIECADNGSSGSTETRARWAFVFNLPCYGWGLPLVPTATSGDGLLDLCTFRRGSLVDGLRYLVAAQLGWHRRLTDCRIQQHRRFRITSVEPVPYQLDGDPGGMLPLEIEVLPRRVTLLVPQK